MYSIVSTRLYYASMFMLRHKWKCVSFFGKIRFNCYDFPLFNDYLLLKSVMWHMCVPCNLCSVLFNERDISYFLFSTVLFSVTILTTQATCQQSASMCHNVCTFHKKN